MIRVGIRAAGAAAKDAQPKDVVCNENDGSRNHNDKEQAAESYRDLLGPAAVQPLDDRRNDAANSGNTRHHGVTARTLLRGRPATCIIPRSSPHLCLLTQPPATRCQEAVGAFSERTVTLTSLPAADEELENLQEQFEHIRARAAQGKDVSGELKEAEAEIGKVREEEQDLHEAEASAKAS